MNKVILMGRLARDAEVRYSQGENSMAIARFTLAVDRRAARNANEGQTADFISCIAFNKRGEFMERFGKKGMKFVITGRIQTGNYTDKDGNKHYTTDVVVEDVEFAESKNNASGASDQAPQQSGNRSQGKPDSDGFLNIPDGIDEELPFA